MEEGAGDELGLLALGGGEVVEGGGVLVLLGTMLVLVAVLVEEGFGCSVVVVVGVGALPKDQVPNMTPWPSVPPKKWKRPVLKSKSPGPQLSHCNNRQ